MAHADPERPDERTVELLRVIESIPDDSGIRCEILHGELVVTPLPNYQHQRLLAQLGKSIHPALPHDWHTFHNTGTFADGHRVLPDLIIIDAIPTSTWTRYTELPVRVVLEIESAVTVTRDRTVKTELYARQGIDAYWRIEENGATHVHTRPAPDGTWHEVRTALPGETLDVTDPFPVTLTPSDWLA